MLDFGITINKPPGRISNLGRDIFEGNGEVDDVEVKIVEPPVCELLLEDRLYLFGVVE